MSVTRKAIVGVAWTAGASWLQVGFSAVTFLLVLSRLAPADLGLYGVASLAIGMVQFLFGGPLNESLEQRKDLRGDHVNATFWIGLTVSAAFMAAIEIFARPLASLLGAPAAAPLMMWLAAALPLGAATGVMRALVVRDQRFRETSQISTAARIVGGLAGIVAITMGAGIWALLISDLLCQVIEFIGLARASRFRPGPPRRLGAFADLMSFNLHTLATYGLSYLDGIIPRLLASTVLGPQGFGYLIIAGRVFGQISALVLAPLGAVTMTSVARLQSERENLGSLVRGLYQLASLVAYPAFLGAIVVVPPLAALAGEKWVPAVLTTQILLLVGLRTATGGFNFGILRGMGHTSAPLALLATGVILQLIFVPIGVQFGAAGVAAALLARTYATWPLGCWFLKRATGVSIRQQIGVGTPALAAALLMAAAGWAALRGLGAEPPLLQLLGAAGVCAIVYPAALALVSPEARRLIVSIATTITGPHRGDVVRNLKAELGL